MRKTIAIVSMFLLGTALYAAPITPGKAMQVAQKVFDNVTPATKAGGSTGLKVIWDGESGPATKASASPAFYVVTRDQGGFVMVSADDNVRPVLAFSYENPFVVENMPCNVAAMMEEIKSYCRSVVSATPEVRRQWEAYTAATKAPNVVDPIVDGTAGLTEEFFASRTNLWNQTNPANYYCPDVPGQTYTAVCGCVSLATAEVMSWFGNANIASASGTVNSYTYTSYNGQSVTVPAHDLGAVYDWANLQLLASYPGQYNANYFYNQIVGYSSASTPEEFYHKIYGGPSFETELTPLGQSLGHLTYDIGTLIEATYNDAENTGTGAYTSRIVSVVAPVMRYSNTSRYVSWSDYTAGEWQYLIRSQVKQHPVIYTGVDNASGGHAYVADGYALYDGDLVFHFNMGWGGQNNGYYFYNQQDEFAYSHYAVINFFPVPDLASSVLLPRICFVDGGGFDPQGGFNTGTLYFNLQNFYSMGSVDFEGDLYVRREDASGNLTDEYLLGSGFSLSPGYGYSNVGLFDITVDNPVLGDKLIACYKENDKDCLPFEYDANVVGLTALPVFPAAFIKTRASYSVGDDFVFELTNNDVTYTNAEWYVTTPGGVRTQYEADDYFVRLETAGEYKIEVVIPNAEETVVAYITVG